VTENLQEAVEQKRSPYESVRDSFSGGEEQGQPTLGALWRDADRWRQHLRDEVASISSNNDLSDEGKQAQIQQAYDRISPRIERESKQARQIAQKKAEEARERAIPGARDARVGTDPTVQTNELLLASELRDRAKRLQESTPRGMQPGARVSKMLSEEYAKATQAGGLSGATACAAVLRAAKSLGIDDEDIYGDMRGEEHNAALEDAYRYQQALNMIPTDVPNVLDRGKSYGNHWRSGGSPRMSIPQGGPLGGGAKRRKPLWK
jgi:hypothetical protein